MNLIKITRLFFLFVIVAASAQKVKTPFEKGNGNQTVTYEEMLRFYKQIDANYEEIWVKNYGLTDSGENLKVVFFSSSKNFDADQPVILINNGIHPGEPDGIDASMMMLRDFAEGRKIAPKNVTIAVIQCYNIGGMLNRGSFSRANQNGPDEYGFRGNARNLDLNRDFIKADSRNAQSFQEIFHQLNPIYFIDNHVSNGADYQYTLTYITTNRNRLGNMLGNYQNDKLVPKVKAELLKKGIISAPYAQINGLKPELGYEAFMDSPRYATGYTSLFNTMGEVVETHMLKPYKNRVEVTYENMLASIDFVDQNIREIKQVQSKNREQFSAGKNYGLDWKIDSTQTKIIDFLGYEAALKASEVSGKPRLYYNRKKTYKINIPFYYSYKPSRGVIIPQFYIVPLSEWKVLDQLKRNRIVLKPIRRDSTITVEGYRISDYKTYTKPYEGHYPHYATQTSRFQERVTFRRGDVLIPANQPGVKYLLETLEPEAQDSFFNWNFFDSILGQKEYFSDYVFEDTAAEILKKDAKLKAELELKKKADPQFAADGAAQLDWVYKNSVYYEKSHLRYPIYRIP